MEYFSQLYASLATELAEWRMALDNPLEPPRVDHEWAYRQLCAWDARNYVVLGDPAARMSIGHNSALPSPTSGG